jgi:predicted nuclease with TOPRIM domain
MIKVRIRKNKEINEDYVYDTEDRLYELHKEIRRLEGIKVKLQKHLKYLNEKIKSFEDRFKPMSVNKILNFCNKINATAKGKLGEK